MIGYLSDSSSDSDEEPDQEFMENYPLISDPFIDHETDPDGLMGTEIDDLYDIDGLGNNTYDQMDDREIMKRLEINLQPFQIALNNAFEFIKQKPINKIQT